MNIYHDDNYDIIIIIVVVIIINNKNIIRARAPEYVRGVECKQFPLCAPSI